MRKHILCVVLCLLLSAVCLAVAANAATIPINSPQEFWDKLMNADSAELKAGHTYELMHDINLGELSVTQKPIGHGLSDYFAGTFNGNNHTISGIAIDYDSGNNVGLFGCVGGTSTIRDLTVVGNVSSEKDHVGGLVGTIGSDGVTAEVTIEGCVNKCKVEGRYNVGGIVGYHHNGTVSIINCTNEGAIKANGPFCGGIVSNMSGGLIEGCVNSADGSVPGADGSVTGTSHVGGIVGIVGNTNISAKILHCKNTGAITATGQYCGGIIAYFTGLNTANSTLRELAYCWNAGAVNGCSSGNADAGGIIGYLFNEKGSDTIHDNLNTGTISGNARIGGCFGVFYGCSETKTVVAYNLNRGTVNETTSATTGDVVGFPVNKCGHDNYFIIITGKEHTNVFAGPTTQGEAYTESVFATLNTNNAWVKTTVGPELVYFHEKDDDGNGYCDSCDAFLTDIKTPAALVNLMTHPALWSGDYTLAANIDLTDVSGQTPIGTEANPFRGTFDGNGFEITLNMDLDSEEDVGLFGRLGEGAVVQNITVDGEVSSSGNFVGGIVGHVYYIDKVTIENCHNKANVTGSRYVGGVVGYLYGKGTTNTVLANCYNSGTITATSASAADVGGIAGIIWGVGSFHDCMATGEVVYKAKNAGGLIGRIHGMNTVSNCYANAKLTRNSSSSTTEVGAFSSSIHANTTITACYFGDAADEGPTYTGIAAYTSADFNDLNANEMWVIADAPELLLFHTHTYDCYTDNGDGTTHSPSCACGATQPNSTPQAHTWNNKIGQSKTDYTDDATPYTCILCGATKAGDDNSFVYDYDVFATDYMWNRTTHDTMSYILGVIVRAYIPENKEIDYYGVAMVPLAYFGAEQGDETLTTATKDENDEYIVFKKNEGKEIENYQTFRVSLAKIPTSKSTLPIYTWVFVKYAGEDVKVFQLGAFKVDEHYTQHPAIAEANGN